MDKVIYFTLGIIVAIIEIYIASLSGKDVEIVFLLVPAFLILAIIACNYTDRQVLEKRFTYALVVLLLVSNFSFLSQKIVYKPKPLLKKKPLPEYSIPQPERKDYKTGWYHWKATQDWREDREKWVKEYVLPVKEENLKIDKDNKSIQLQNIRMRGKIDLSRNKSKIFWLFLASVTLPFVTKTFFGLWIAELKGKEKEVYKEIESSELIEYREKYNTLLAEKTGLERTLKTQENIYDTLLKDSRELSREYESLKKAFQSLNEAQGKNPYLVKYYVLLNEFKGIPYPDKKTLSMQSGYDTRSVNRIIQQEIKFLRSNNIRKFGRE